MLPGGPPTAAERVPGVTGYNRALIAVSVVIPAYNEEARLPSTLASLVAFFEGKPEMRSEVLVVDDGSADRTAQVAESYAGRGVAVRVLRNPGNRGKGYSVRHGMLEAAGDWVLFTDADLSAPIEELDKLIAERDRTGADVVIGSRALDRSLIGVHQSMFREQAGRVFNLLMQLLLGLPFWDTQCGFKLYSREVARQAFGRQRIDGFGFDAEVLFIARKRGYKIAEVPVRWNHVEGTKVSMAGDSATMFLDLVRVRWNQVRGKYR